MGIDPGLSATGYGIVEAGRVLDFGVITTDTKQSTAERLADIGTRLDRVLRLNRPALCAIESLFFKGGGARSVLLSAEARGVILAALGRREIPVREVTPATVKLAVSGSGRASKQQVNYMIKRLLRLDDRVPEHAADALAAAYCLSRRQWKWSSGEAPRRPGIRSRSPESRIPNPESRFPKIRGARR